jgi:hypothetical protein
MLSSGVMFVPTVVKTDSNSGIVVHACADTCMHEHNDLKNILLYFLGRKGG